MLTVAKLALKAIRSCWRCENSVARASQPPRLQCRPSSKSRECSAFSGAAS